MVIKQLAIVIIITIITVAIALHHRHHQIIVIAQDCHQYLTHWHLELFAKISFFFDILVVLKLDRGQISFSLVENALVSRQLAILATRIAFKTFWPRHAQKSKFWDSFWTRKWPTALGFSTFEFFFPFPFYPRFFFLLLWLAISRACLGLKKISGRVIKVANFYHGAARCSGRKFGSEFFAQLF